jgi:hypothetical protein
VDARPERVVWLGATPTFNASWEFWDRLPSRVAAGRPGSRLVPRAGPEEIPMRALLHVEFPNARFNNAVKEGTAGKKINRILEETKPEAVYFTEYNGRRGAIMIVNIDEPSKVPVLAEPWFLEFDAEVKFRVAMTPEDLRRAGLEALGKKWS